MTTTQLIILLLVIVVAVALVLLLVRRSSAKKDEARAEAAGIRAEAEGVAGAMAGQQVFAQQADERAELARAEAEAAARQAADAAREADRLAAEAGQHRAAVEETRTDYTSMLARADEVDPDVRTPEPQETVALAADDDREPQTRAEARARREDAERAAWAESPAAPVPGASGAAVAGAGIWAAQHDEEHPAEEHAAEERPADERGDAERHDEDAPATASVDGAWWDEPTDVEGGRIAPAATDETQIDVASTDEAAVAEHPAAAHDGGSDEDRSARIATAADYRDPADEAPAAADAHDGPGTDPAAGSGEVWTGAAAGTEAGMTTTSGSFDDPTTAPAGDDETVDAAQDARTPTNEWGGPHDDSDSLAGGATVAGDAPVVDAAAVREHEGHDHDHAGHDHDHAGHDHDHAGHDHDHAGHDHDHAGHDHDHAGHDHDHDEQPAGAVQHEGSSAEPDADAPRDWAGDEPGLLAENQERGDRLADDREQMERDAAAAGMDTPHHVEPEHDEPTRVADLDPTADAAHEDLVSHDASSDEAPTAHDGAPVHDEPVAHDELAGHDEPAAHDESASSTDIPAEEAPAPATARRVSEFHEIRDGGYGMGSAAALDDGAQPMDHPVQAYRDTMTFRVPGDPGYDDARADVWFYDAGAAERSGFRRSEG